MIVKKSLGDHVFDAILSIFMLCVFVVSVYPFLYILNYSISSVGMIKSPLLLWPQGVNFDSYRLLLADSTIYRAFFISVLRATIGPVIMLVVTTMGAYALSRPNLILGKFFRIYFLFTMYFSAGVIPQYLLMKNLGLTNTFFVYIIPTAVSAFNMILVKTYIESIPPSLEEAVLIDGGTEIDAFFRVLLRLCLPVNAAVVLFSCINHWNAFIDAQLYNAMAPRFHTLQYVLYNMLAVQMTQSLEEAERLSLVSRVNNQSLKLAITVITIVPIMMVYPFLRKYFVSGLLIGAIKA